MLAPEAQALWNDLRTAPELSSFVLIGGSALAHRIGHRLSEDLNFTTTATRLPRAVIDRYLFSRPEKWERRDDPAAYDEFQIAGMELHDYQQDFTVDGAVKVTFFTANNALGKALDDPSFDEKGPRLAKLDELFQSKAILSAARSRTRDRFDLFTRFTKHGFSSTDYRKAFIRSGIPSQWEAGIGRMCSGNVPQSDEGYLHLVENPPTLDEMLGFFHALRDKIEQQIASESTDSEVS